MGSNESSLDNRSRRNRTNQSESSPLPLPSFFSNGENGLPDVFNSDLPPPLPEDSSETTDRGSPSIAVIQTTNSESQMRRTLFIISYVMPNSSTTTESNVLQMNSGNESSDGTRRMVMMIMGSSANQSTENNSQRESESFSQLLNRFLELYEPRGAPPASKEAIETLDQTVIDDALLSHSPKCTICCEDFEPGKKVVKLPCTHVFDQPCIEPWLQMHNTCPVCRYELPVDDPELEKQRLERMASHPQRPQSDPVTVQVQPSQPTTNVQSTTQTLPRRSPRNHPSSAQKRSKSPSRESPNKRRKS